MHRFARLVYSFILLHCCYCGCCCLSSSSSLIRLGSMQIAVTNAPVCIVCLFRCTLFIRLFVFIRPRISGWSCFGSHQKEPISDMQHDLSFELCLGFTSTYYICSNHIYNNLYIPEHFLSISFPFTLILQLSRSSMENISPFAECF